jgi:hypothetical protein
VWLILASHGRRRKLAIETVVTPRFGVSTNTSRTPEAASDRAIKHFRFDGSAVVRFSFTSEFDVRTNELLGFSPERRPNSSSFVVFG